MCIKNNCSSQDTSLKIINILITIDTDAVMKDYSSTSLDKNKPIGIAHKYGFMVATNAKINKGQGTGDLDFNANVGDCIRMYALSASNNFDDSVLMYKINKFGGVEVFNEFKNQDYYKNVIVPSDGNDVLPGKSEKMHFWFYEASVKNTGTEDYKVNFAIYKRDDSGEAKLHSYYSWDPRIQVKN